LATVAVYDTCILHAVPFRDLLIRRARAGLVQAWRTDRILDQCFRSVRRPEHGMANKDDEDVELALGVPRLPPSLRRASPSRATALVTAPSARRAVHGAAPPRR
jgi:hypothetical protein